MVYKSWEPEGMLLQTQSITLPPRRHRKTRLVGLIQPTALLLPQEGEATLGIFRDILLSQPEAVHESQIQTQPWLAPPFLPPTTSDVMETPRDQRTP